ncbi:hypothetical protein NQ363_27070, partial [Escherichia coli]|nr:hypothetical protein [Escherichia coli]
PSLAPGALFFSSLVFAAQNSVVFLVLSVFYFLLSPICFLAVSYLYLIFLSFSLSFSSAFGLRLGIWVFVCPRSGRRARSGSAHG